MKNITKTTKETKETCKGIPTWGAWGIGMLFVCISIGYANYVVFFGTEGIIPKAMLIPSTLFVAYFLVNKAVK